MFLLEWYKPHNSSHITSWEPRREFILSFFWQIHIPNDPLWLICEQSNIVLPACFSLWDHEQLLAHNYVVIHCYLEEETRTDSFNFLFYFLYISIHYIYSRVYTAMWTVCEKFALAVMTVVVIIFRKIWDPSFSLGHLLPELVDLKYI